MRAHSVKSELSDIEGLGFRLEERQQDILQLKKSLKLKVRRDVVGVGGGGGGVCVYIVVVVVVVGRLTFCSLLMLG